MISIFEQYLIKKFFISLLKITGIFSSIIIVMNLFEEINFFKDYDTNNILPIFLTFINLPTLLFEIFPFIFLITAIYFFLNLIEDGEIYALKIYSITNLSLIKSLCLTTFLFGILIVTIFYSFSAKLKFQYLEIKNSYSKDDKYLAAVTANGLWIRDALKNKIYYINSETMKRDNLEDISIIEFKENYELERIIVAKKAIIKEKKWILIDVLESKDNQTQKFKQIFLETNFQSKKIKSLFDNLSALNLYELKKLKEDYRVLGYSTNKLINHEHKIYSLPIFITMMVALGAILMLNTKFNKSKFFHVMIGIFISVVIYYLVYFFNVVIGTRYYNIFISIWAPQLFLAMIIFFNLVRINEK